MLTRKATRTREREIVRRFVVPRTHINRVLRSVHTMLNTTNGSKFGKHRRGRVKLISAKAAAGDDGDYQVEMRFKTEQSAYRTLRFAEAGSRKWRAQIYRFVRYDDHMRKIAKLARKQR